MDRYTSDYFARLTSNEIQICGSVLLLFSALLIIIQVGYIVIICQRISNKSGFVFHLMFCVAIVDLLQLLLHGISGIVALSFTPSATWMKTISAIMAASWMAMVLFTCLLTTHRFFYVGFGSQAWTLFPDILSKLLALLIICFSLAEMITLIIVGGADFSPSTITWTFIHDGGLVSSIQYLDQLSKYVYAFYNFFAYVVLFTYFTFGNSSKRSRRDFDIRVTLRIAPQSIFASLCIFYWLFLEPALGLSPVGHFVGHMLWASWNGVSACVHLATYRDPVGQCPDPVTSTSLSQQEKTFFKSLTHKLIRKL